MPQSFHSADEHSNAKPLPLFRPEVLAAQQQKFHGQIVLIRPFSLMLLVWIALGVTAATFGFLLLGQYTERAHVTGIIAAADQNTNNDLQASLFVPARLMGRLHSGSQFTLRCETCAAPFSQPTGTVLAVSDTPMGSAELSQMDLKLSGPVYKIPVRLTPQAAPTLQANPLPQTGTRVEAEIPLGRKPLIKWFFERSGS